MKPEYAERMAHALIATLDNWMEHAEEIAETAGPVSDTRRKALHLKMSMAQAKMALEAMLDPPPP